MAITFVQNAFLSGSFFGSVRTAVSNPTGIGHLVIVIATGSAFGYGGLAGTISDNGGNTWTLLGGTLLNGSGVTLMGVWYTICTKPMTQITNASCQQIAMWEYVGVDKTNPVDVFATNQSVPVGPVITTTHAGDLVFAAASLETSFGGGSSLNPPYLTNNIQISCQQWLMGGANFPGAAGLQPGQTFSAWNWGSNLLVAFTPAIIAGTGTQIAASNQVQDILPIADGGTGTSAIGASGTFTTVDSKTVTVVNGFITSIV